MDTRAWELSFLPGQLDRGGVADCFVGCAACGRIVGVIRVEWHRILPRYSKVYSISSLWYCRNAIVRNAVWIMALPDSEMML